MASTVLISGLLLSACSQNADNMAGQQSQKAAVPVVKGVAHTHPANKCTNSISHTHPNGGSVHKHHYDCRPNSRVISKKPSIAHKHPANKCTRSISHSHPNGDSTHSHRYNCKGNMAKSANMHKHPANKCTRTISHAHPNGKRAHAHRYSCQGNVKMGANQHKHPANKCTRTISHAHPNGKRATCTVTVAKAMLKWVPINTNTQRINAHAPFHMRIQTEKVNMHTVIVVRAKGWGMARA